jgi:hypothetical protein
LRTNEALTPSTEHESYRKANGKYPSLADGVGHLATELTPRFARDIQQKDAYGREYIVLSDTSGVAVVSTGRNGYVVRRGSVVFPADGSFSK